MNTKHAKSSINRLHYLRRTLQKRIESRTREFSDRSNTPVGKVWKKPKERRSRRGNDEEALRGAEEREREKAVKCVGGAVR